MRLTDTLRRTKLVKALKAQANSPRLGQSIRWSARQMRKLDGVASRANAENRAHDKAQTALLESYRNR